MVPSLQTISKNQGVEPSYSIVYLNSDNSLAFFSSCLHRSSSYRPFPFESSFPAKNYRTYYAASRCSPLLRPIPCHNIAVFISHVRCVCVFSSHLFWTSSSLDVPAENTQEEGHTGFFVHLLSVVRALIVLARRIQSFLSLVDREVEFCVLTI